MEQKIYWENSMVSLYKGSFEELLAIGEPDSEEVEETEEET